MSQALNKIQEMFNNSDVDPIMANDLLVFLPILPENALEELGNAFEEDPKLINDFVKNFKAKFEALMGQQISSAAEIEAEENDNEFSDEIDSEDNFEDIF